jgi:peptidoglycan/xylan/chitin deacetylase (PgdA/CDA1 family)
MNYLAHLIRSKGLGQLGQRALSIGRRYGMTPGTMVQAFERLVSTLEQYECRATFPVTAVALARHPAPIRQLQERGMELAVHGWTHVDLGRYSLEEQREHLSRASNIFERHGISAAGFRSPYLRRNGTIREAVEAIGFRYLSNQPILWDVAGESDQPRERAQAYRQAVNFYTPWSSTKHLSLPAVQGQMVEIPVSLPDDEMLVERLGASSAQIAQIWTKILHQTYVREELFTIQLHPERAMICSPAVSHVLSEARSYSPPVWIARLDEIAEWWQQLLTLRFDVTHEDRSQYHIALRGPAQASALVRSAQVVGESEAWGDGYRLVRSHRFSVRCSSQPLIGVSGRTNHSLVNFLKRQGYLLETSEEGARYSIYLDRPNFALGDEKPLIQQIEATRSPLIRTSRWPGGAHSALAITGDIDALTLWDYGLRIFGK